MTESEDLDRVGTGPARYRIVVRGDFGPLAWPFENLEVSSYSVIVGEIIDQGQLHGVLEWLGERGVQIVRMTT